jgi:hypothetical protein
VTRIISIIVFLIGLSGCSIATTANLAGKVPPADQVTIYIPDSFIVAVDDNELGRVGLGDQPTIVQLLTVEPGVRTYGGRVQVDEPTMYVWWNFRFRLVGEPGHTYYLWFERVGQEDPRIFGRDLGLGVPVSSLPVSPAFGLRSTSELAQERRVRDALREKGVPIDIELLPRD